MLICDGKLEKQPFCPPVRADWRQLILSMPNRGCTGCTAQCARDLSWLAMYRSMDRRYENHLEQTQFQGKSVMPDRAEVGVFS